MNDFDGFLAELKKSVGDLAQQTLKGGVDAAKADFEDFEEKAKAEWQLWTTALAKGDMDQNDLAGLLRGQVDLAKMHALTAAGLAAERIQKFRDAVIKIVFDTAIKTFL